jgi:chromosome segregation ATPase
LLTEETAIEQLREIETDKKPKLDDARDEAKRVDSAKKTRREKLGELKKIESTIKKINTHIESCSKQIENAITSADKLKEKFNKDNEKWRAKWGRAKEKVTNLESDLSQFAEHLKIEKGLLQAKQNEILRISEEIGKV